MGKKIKLNIGSGDVKLPGFINLDGKFGDNITSLDYDKETVDEIYASHVLEYFDQVEVIDVLKNWYNTLKKGGILRIAVPDFESLTELYLNNDVRLRDIMGPLFGRMKMGKKTIYHKTVYNSGSLAQLLYYIGFKRIKIYDCEKVKPFSKIDDQSHAYIPHMDKNGKLISLNVECVK